MLQGMTMASPPAALMPSATSWQASALREETTTLAPSFASSSADERPIPRLEPVTTATLPVRSNGVFFTGASFRHSGTMRSIEPGISRFRVWSFGPSRNDGLGLHQPAALRNAAQMIIGVAEGVLDHG